MTHQPAYRIDDRIVGADAFYAAACDPRRSIVVEACAGAGKTWMLVSRILRALLAGAQPQEILALTFTRKAAGEMRERLDEWLRGFSIAGTVGDEDLERLARELRLRGLADAQARALAPALAGLHERLLADGRGVAIRSFHAWFAQLVAAAPLETLRAIGLPPQPELIEDTEPLADELFARFHRALQADPARRDDYAQLIGRHRLARVSAWLHTAWQRRIEVERADAAGVLDGSVAPVAALWPACATFATPEAQVLAPPLRGRLDALARELGALDKDTPRKAAEALRRALETVDPAAAFGAACAALMTADGAPRKRMGDLAEHARACAALQEIGRQVDQQQAWEDHGRMVRLARVLLGEYAQLKREQGLADMGDLETAALALLADPTLAGWLQLRLDARLRHVLIDEFQDTSPLQWQALFGWLSSYAGAGGGASGQAPPSVFIVGDPKQSIYRFRRAEPRVFAAAKAFVVDGLGGAVLACDHTRRCAPAVVETLNAVLAPAAESGEWPGFREHTTASAAHGVVRRLPDVVRPPRTKGEAVAAVWRDTLTQPRHEPEELLRQQEARQVACAIAELLVQGRRPREIMVLARKRVALRAVADALAEARLPCVMPEAMNLGDEPEARDLLAVLDVLASPGHDLSLAQALRSPLFGASDDELLALAGAAAGGSWRAALLDPQATWSGALERARRLLARWVAVADWLPPHDLLDRIVDEGEVVPRLVAAVPPARRALALAVVDGLLAAALQLDGGRYTSPYAFVRQLRARAVEATAAGAADAVRLLTVHGAKGLEAPIVFVVDADPNRSSPDGGTLLVDWPVDAPAPQRAAFVALDSRPPASLQALHLEERRERAREELNGLYVAMTRAGEQLVISRTEPYLAAEGTSWWGRVAPRAADWVPASAAGHGDDDAARERTWHDLPRWSPATRGADGGGDGDCGDGGGAARDAERAALGRAVHRTLEWASQGPTGGVSGLRAAALAAAREAGLEAAEAAMVASEAATILADPDLARFFPPSAMAWAGNEVPVVVDGVPGRIDRLVALDEGAQRSWWVLDYKMEPEPERRATSMAQLTGYVRAVRALQPGDRVCGAFVASGGRLVPVDV